MKKPFLKWVFASISMILLVLALPMSADAQAFFEGKDAYIKLIEAAADEISNLEQGVYQGRMEQSNALTLSKYYKHVADRLAEAGYRGVSIGDLIDGTEPQGWYLVSNLGYSGGPVALISKKTIEDAQDAYVDLISIPDLRNETKVLLTQ